MYASILLGDIFSREFEGLWGFLRVAEVSTDSYSVRLSKKVA